MIETLEGTTLKKLNKKEEEKKMRLKKYRVNLGARDGFLNLCLGGKDDPEKKLLVFSAFNAAKPSLWKVYDYIESRIVRTLAVLTATGKTRIVLLPEGIEKKIMKFAETLPDKVVFDEWI